MQHSKEERENYVYIIIILSCSYHRFPSLSHHSSLSSIASAGLLDYIVCPYRTVVDSFLLAIQNLHVYVKGFIGEHRLSDRLHFFNSVPHVLLVFFVWFRDGGRWPYSCRFMRCCFQDLIV